MTIPAHHSEAIERMEAAKGLLDEAIQVLLDATPPPAGPSVTLNPASGAPMSHFDAVMTGFPPDTPIHIHFHSSPRSAPTTDSQGNRTVQVTVPERVPGDYPVTFTVRDETEPLVTVMFTVTDTPVALVSDVVASTGKPYELDSLAEGKDCYIDRSHTFTQVPAELQGLPFIRTANDDRDKPLALTFVLGEDAQVYVAFDNRVGVSELPDWLDGWAVHNSLTIQTSDVARRVLSKTFPAGMVSLGAAGMNPNSGSNYNVVVKSAG